MPNIMRSQCRTGMSPVRGYIGIGTDYTDLKSANNGHVIFLIL